VSLVHPASPVAPAEQNAIKVSVLPTFSVIAYSTAILGQCIGLSWVAARDGEKQIRALFRRHCERGAAIQGQRTGGDMDCRVAPLIAMTARS
jgi:hypothetical protein